LTKTSPSQTEKFVNRRLRRSTQSSGASVRRDSREIWAAGNIWRWRKRGMLSVSIQRPRSMEPPRRTREVLHMTLYRLTTRTIRMELDLSRLMKTAKCEL